MLSEAKHPLQQSTLATRRLFTEPGQAKPITGHRQSSTRMTARSPRMFVPWPTQLKQTPDAGHRSPTTGHWPLATDH